MATTSDRASKPIDQDGGLDPEEAIRLLLRDLRSSADGLATAESQRRLLQYGSNELRRQRRPRWPAELAAQLIHPLALLLWAAAGLSFAVGNGVVGIAVLLVIALNAVFALAQELQAERAVEALTRYLPHTTTALRDGRAQAIDVHRLVPDDVVLLEEGERVPADVRLLEGAVELDMSTLTGESAPVLRSAELVDVGVPRMTARDLAFMGGTCTEGEARAVAFATGMHTELEASLPSRSASRSSEARSSVRFAGSRG